MKAKRSGGARRRRVGSGTSGNSGGSGIGGGIGGIIGIGINGNRNKGGRLLWLVVLEKSLKLLESDAGGGHFGVEPMPNKKMHRRGVN